MRYVWPVLAIIVAAGLQGNVPGWMRLFGAKPDLVLVVLVAYAISNDPEVGALLGFLAGVVEGSAVGCCVGSFIVTRTITGFLAGFVTMKLFSENVIVPAVSAAWLTAACEGLFLLANPRLSVMAAGRTILGECVLNMLLTLVLCLVLKHFETRRKIRLANAWI